MRAYGRRQLYLCEDELLQVETMYFMQNYRRFAYADIQSFLVRQTPRGLIYNVILGVLVAGGGVLAWSMEAPEFRWVWLGIAGFFGVLLLINLVRGATCRCQLQTAVGPHPLPTLSRMRTAQKALRLLGERIAAAQGALAPDDAASRVDRLLAEGNKG